MKGINRFVAWLLVLSWLMLPVGALAASAQDMSISVQWTDGVGNVRLSDMAVPVSADMGENRFWITLPLDAPLDGLTLNISDLTGGLSSFMPGQGETLANVQDAMGSLNAVPVEIHAFNANGEYQGVYYLYLSYSPLQDAAPQPAQVTVHYTDEYGQMLLEDRVLTLEEGVHTVSAEQIPGYELFSPGAFSVTVDASGAFPSDITFAYLRAQVSADVTVHYTDVNGIPLMADQVLSFQEGASTVSAPALEGYTLQGMEEYQIIVDASGALPNEVTFVYSRLVSSANVTVHYVDENGLPLLNDVIYTFDAGEHPVSAANIDQYTASGSTTVLVTVDENGAAPSEITFTYTRYVPPATVTVHYVDENGASLLPDAQLTLEGGAHTLYAETIDRYALDGPDSLPVNVTLDGAVPSEITFLYKLQVLPVEIPLHYVDENGAPLAQDTAFIAQPGSNIVYPAAAIAPDEYLITGPSSYEVYVTAEGASPAEVTFTYQRVAKAAVVTLHYVDETGTSIAPDSFVTVEPGIRQVGPEDLIPQDEYALTSEGAVAVIVDVNGANPAEITFTYQRLVQPVDVTIHYVDERGETIAADTVQTFGEGDHEILPNAPISAEDYELSQPVSYPLTVSLDGGSVSEVTFVYNRRVKPAAVTVHYTDAQGSALAADTQQTLEGGSFVVFPQPQDLPENYVLIEGSPAFQDVTVDADGAHPSEITFVYEYRIAGPVTLPIRYLDEESGMDVATAGSIRAEAGVTTSVSAEPYDLLENYVLVSEPTVEVFVDAAGHCDVTEIVFLYRYTQSAEAPTEEPTQEPTEEPTEEPTQEPTEEPTEEPTQEPTEAPTEAPVIQPALVNVKYVDQEGNDVASPTQVWCEPGDSVIFPDPADLQADWQLTGPDSVSVHVDEFGAFPVDAVFTYRYAPEAPAPKVALVNVKYVNPDGEAFYSYTATCVEGQKNTVRLDWDQVDSTLGYELASEAEVDVTVDSNGNAEPAEVVFKFRNEVNGYVTVLYQDAQTGREVASPQQYLCYVGSNTIDARPDNLEENYTLEGSGSANVFLNENGQLTPDTVVFRYVSLATATPAPQPPTFETALDAYFYPTGTGVRVRSTPTTAEDNIVGMANSGDLGHALGQLVSDGKVWYAVEINGVMGYMNESVVRFLNEAELAALFGYTMAPTQEPTAAPTAIPDGAPIDRWAKTTAAVNFRRSADRSGERISELKKNTRVWVFSSQTINGEKWYSVRVSGTDGFLMADYVEVASEAESEEIQAQLSSPMPTQQPAATQAPTAEPTQEPTQEPTAEPTQEPTQEPTAEPTLIPTEAPTETPLPYKGYALTSGQAALRTGVSQTDDTILEMLPPDSLLFVQSQTYVDNVPWAFVQSVSSGNLGFILQSSIQSITSEEARPYLEQIQTTPAATATAVPEQAEGYAMTLGEGVPMRNFPDTNGEIIMLLPYMAVANVRGQQYAGNAAWHLVQYNGMWGYIRQDQLRMMSQEEVAAYEESLMGGTPTPSPAPTPEPLTQESLSSYGHVQSNSGRVNLRSEPTTKKDNAIRLLDNYAFALVLGTVTNDEGTWYHVSQGGNEGYIRSDYFRVLPLGELSTFLQSSEYLNANSNNTSSGATSSQIQPVEDYNQTVWQNPALSASYEPFNPFVTPTPDPERLPTETPVPTATPSPTPEIAPVGPQDNPVQPETNVQQGGSPWPWVLLGLAVLGGGGAYYAYTVRKQTEKRRQAQRAQQARQARSAAAQQPHMRAAQNNPNQGVNRASYPNQSAPFMPPQGASPRPTAAANIQNTGVYRPRTAQPAQQPPQAQPGAGETQAFQPVRQETQAYQPRRQNNVYQPLQQTQVYGNQSLFNGMTKEDMDALASDTQAFKPAPVDPNAQRLNLNIKVAKLDLEDFPAEPEAPQAPARKRVRRTERNKDLYDDNGEGGNA